MNAELLTEAVKGMGFVCPECLWPGSLNIISGIELDGDGRSDDITLQIIECSACRFRAVAVYEESRRGALDSECSDLYAYHLSSVALESLRALIAECPNPSGSCCQCHTHAVLNRTDKSGQWNALDDFNKGDYFPMRPAPTNQ